MGHRMNRLVRIDRKDEVLHLQGLFQASGRLGEISPPFHNLPCGSYLLCVDEFSGVPAYRPPNAQAPNELIELLYKFA